MNRALLSVAASGISLAAAPVFAVMALAGAIAPAPIEKLCSPARVFPLPPMSQMYLLMSFFHFSAWLRAAPWRHGS